MTNSFANAVLNQDARTENGMKARKGSSSAVVDMFYKIGAMRGQNILPIFSAANAENRDLALRVALWSRDVRKGAGERDHFRNILSHLEKTDAVAAKALMRKVPELGRWDDLLINHENLEFRNYAFDMIRDALAAGNGLTAKWMPRKGPVAAQLRSYLGWTPKYYRKRLVELTKVVETAMCAKDWDSINFSHVPSKATSNYKKAFWKNAPVKFKEYLDALKKPVPEGEKPTVKINAGAIYPHDVVKDMYASVTAYGLRNQKTLSASDIDHITAQWNALPNYMGDSSVLAMVDVSGSMESPAGKDTSVTALQVAMSLGLYCADKLSGPFKDTFLTFSGKPELMVLKGSIYNKFLQMKQSNWDMNTNLHAAFERMLDVAKSGKVSDAEMPKIVLILSDMQFDQCVRFDDSAFTMIKRKYEDAGYTLPSIVFWNLRSADNVPVKANEKGTALVSGYSPSILEAVLKADMKDFSPEGIMLKKIMTDRYDPQLSAA